MKDLIEALTLLQKYQKDTHNPTHCEHDQLTVVGIDNAAMTAEDKLRLKDLGFWPDDEGCYSSFRFGSA